MKKQLMVVEDSFNKYMVTKQIIECGLHVPVKELQFYSHNLAKAGCQRRRPRHLRTQRWRRRAYAPTPTTKHQPS